MANFVLIGDTQSPARGQRNGVDLVFINANDETDARAAAKSLFDGDEDEYWGTLASVTSLVAATDLEGWRLRVVIFDSSPVVDVTYTGVAADLVDDMGAGIVPLLNATSVIANASYDAPSNVLTVAGAADNIGDKQMQVSLLAPTDSGVEQPDTVFPDFVQSITDQGAAGDALTATLATDAYRPPNLSQAFQAKFLRED